MYTVRWTQSALEELADVWVSADATERVAINTAADQVDALLSNAPENEGESRAGNRRITFVAPLVLVFTVDSPHGIVRVLHVSRYGTS
jgi:plasmid stabilization system protein ParE